MSLPLMTKVLYFNLAATERRRISESEISESLSLSLTLLEKTCQPIKAELLFCIITICSLRLAWPLTEGGVKAPFCDIP